MLVLPKGKNLVVLVARIVGLVCLIGGLAASVGAADTCAVARIGALPSWSPHYEHRDGKFDGPLVKYVSKMFADLGIKTDLLPIKPVKRALRDMDDGKVDVFLAGFYTEDRAKRYVFSEPLFVNSYGLIYRKEKGQKPLSDARLATFSFYRQWPQMDVIKEKGPTIFEVESFERAVRMFKENRADYIYTNIESFSIAYKRAGLLPRQLVLHPIYSIEKQARMLVRKNWACSQRLDDINAYLISNPYLQHLNGSQIETSY
jgi:ABC-type amino acid transport substrate-binding protein